ncbi:MAG: hypothetical protein ACLS48_13230 [[Eubacterium] siraeum]
MKSEPQASEWDNDLEKQINEVKAQLKYSQLDEFSREQMEKKLQDCMTR